MSVVSVLDTDQESKILVRGISKFPMKDEFGRVTGYSDATKAQQICIHSEMSMLWAWKSSIL